jgi:DNA-binding transcriptional regulator LsrR (DeoR family)
MYNIINTGVVVGLNIEEAKANDKLKAKVLAKFNAGQESAEIAKELGLSGRAVSILLQRAMQSACFCVTKRTVPDAARRRRLLAEQAAYYALNEYFGEDSGFIVDWM